MPDPNQQGARGVPDKGSGLTHLTCEGWNSSQIAAAAFEASGKGTDRAAARVHALTQEGEMLSISLGPALRGPCKVRHPAVVLNHDTLGR